MLVCKQCFKQKSFDDFAFNKSSKTGRRSVCKVCQRVYQKNYYQENKDAYNAKSYELRDTRRQASRKYVVNYLNSNPCVDCGESDFRILEFDHVRGTKIMGVGKMIHDSFGLEKIKQEIDKCEVRCCNCHRKVTLQRADVDFSDFLD